MGTDPKQSICELLEAKLDRAALTKDDGTTMVKWKALYEAPPWTLLKDFLLGQGYDLLFTVGRLRVEPGRFIQGIPLQYDGRFPVRIWCIDKRDSDGNIVITGERLRWKACEEVRRVFEENPSGSKQRVSGEEDDDRLLGGEMLYTTNLIVTKVTYT